MKNVTPIVSKSLLVLFMFCLLAPPSFAMHRWVCRDCDPFMQPNYPSVNAAVIAADPGDTVCIVAEENPFGSGDIIHYTAPVVLDKPLTLTCREIHPVLGYPVITLDSFDDANQVIHVTPAAAGTVISNLHIQGPPADTTACSGNPRDVMTDRAGIRIDAPNVTITSCTITRCMTGIVIASDQSVTVSGCTIGDRWIGTVNGAFGIEETWTDSHAGQPILHPGNGFGIVIQKTGTLSKSAVDKERKSVIVIRDNTIQSNRYEALVIPEQDAVTLENNILKMNAH